MLGHELGRLGKDFTLGLERAQHHPQERKNPDDADDSQHDVRDATAFDESLPQRQLVVLRRRGASGGLHCCAHINSP